MLIELLGYKRGDLIVPKYYMTTDTEIALLADTIREKSGTSAPLRSPSEFIDAIQGIPTNTFVQDDFSSYENSTVTAIGIGKFAYQNELQTVSFPGCLSIKERAFNECTSLSTVSFPECLSIERYAFGRCAFSNITFPKCISVGEYAFTVCNSLLTANFPECTTLNVGAFQNCNSLSSIYFPE